MLAKLNVAHGDLADKRIEGDLESRILMRCRCQGPTDGYF